MEGICPCVTWWITLIDAMTDKDYQMYFILFLCCLLIDVSRLFIHLKLLHINWITITHVNWNSVSCINGFLDALSCPGFYNHGTELRAPHHSSQQNCVIYSTLLPHNGFIIKNKQTSLPHLCIISRPQQLCREVGPRPRHRYWIRTITIEAVIFEFKYIGSLKICIFWIVW